MNFDEFTGEVQHRLELPGTGEAVRAIRATLVTLSQRIQEGDASDLASSLPMEIDWYLTGGVDEHGQRFDWDEFLDRICEIEDVERSEAAFHVQVVVDLIETAATDTDFQQLRDGLPEGDEGWDTLFELVDAGGWEGTREAEPGGAQ